MLHGRNVRIVRGKRASLAIARDFAAPSLNGAPVGASAVAGIGESLRSLAMTCNDTADVVQTQPSFRELPAAPSRPIAAQPARSLTIELERLIDACAELARGAVLGIDFETDRGVLEHGRRPCVR